MSCDGNCSSCGYRCSSDGDGALVEADTVADIVAEARREKERLLAEGERLRAANDSLAHGDERMREACERMQGERNTAEAERDRLRAELQSLVDTFRRHGGGTDVYASHVSGAQLAALRSRARLEPATEPCKYCRGPTRPHADLVGMVCCDHCERSWEGARRGG